MVLVTRCGRMTSIRWVFDCSQWQITSHHWLKCIGAIQSEERERIGRFVFQNDAISSLVGRLLMRKLVVETCGLPWDKVRLARSERGKPYVMELAHELVFNVSHHGKMTVLAAEVSGRNGTSSETSVGIVEEENENDASEHGAVEARLGQNMREKCDITREEATEAPSVRRNVQLGVDISSYAQPRSTTIAQFFRIMKRNLHEEEWDYVLNKQLGELAQLARFYRIWTLKESYVKATGSGLGPVPLDEICFRVSSEPEVGRCVYDTTLTLAGEPQDGWLFEESKLGDEFCVSVAVNYGGGLDVARFRDVDRKYETVGFEDIERVMKELEDQSNAEELFYEAQDFVKKTLRPWNS